MSYLQVTSDKIFQQGGGGGGGEEKNLAWIFDQILPEFCSNLPQFCQISARVL